MNWERRNRVFLVGGPLALIPAVAFLPLFVFVFLRFFPRATPYSAGWPAIAFPVLVFAQTLGTVLVGFAGFGGRLGYVTFLAAAVLVLLMIVAGYTGLFFGIVIGLN